MENIQYSCLPWGEEGEDEDEDENEWRTWHPSTSPAKRQSNRSINGSSNSPAKKKLKMDSFCTSSLTDSSFQPTDSSCDVLVSRYNHKRTIIHIDIDCFYAQVEMVLNPSLQNKPLGIQQKYIIVTCNYVARERGLTKLMRISDAKTKCPDLVLVNGENLSKYRDFSKRVNDLLQGITPNVERLGLDENFVDVTDLVEARLGEINDLSALHPDGIVYGEEGASEKKICSCGCHQRLTIGSQIAAQLRKRIFDEIGLTCCAGIAHNKLLAKLSGECHKPNKQTLLFPEFVKRFIRSLPARKIPGIGSSTCKKLQSMGINSVPELQSCSLVSLQSEFGDGPLALTLKRLSHGVDDADVIPSGAPKSMSEEDTYYECSSLNEITKNLLKLANNLILRLTDDIGCPQTIRLTIRRGIGELAGDRKESRQGPIPSKFFSSKLPNDQKLSILLSAMLDLFKKLVNIKQPFKIKLLNICLTNFQKPSKCGKRAFSNFFMNTQAGTSNKECTSCENSKINFGSGYQDDKESKSIFVTKNIDDFEPKNSHPYNSLTSKNKVSNSLKLFKGSITSLLGSSCPSKDTVASEKQYNIETLKIGNSCSSEGIPSEVDPEVFNSLPVDVQKELIEQWKQEQKSPVQKKAQTQPKGLLRYFSKPP